MKLWIASLALLATLLPDSAQAAPVGTPYSPVTAFWRIPDHYKVTADGADDAPSIQRAIDAICASSTVWGSGGILRFMPRHYAINSAIVQKCNVIWEGAGWQEAPDTGANSTTAVPNTSLIAAARGTWFDISSAFAGSSSSPITLTEIGANNSQAKGSQIRNVAFWEPGQALPSATIPTAWTPIAYPPVISIYNVGGFVKLENVFMNGVYRGISSNNGGRTIVEGLYGQFFDYAVFVDNDFDTTRINNIHDWTYWSPNSNVVSWQQDHSNNIVLGRVDSPLIDNIIGLGINTTIYFTAGTDGVTTGALIGKVHCDGVKYCIKVDGGGVTAAFSQVRAWPYSFLTDAPIAGSAPLYITGDAYIYIGTIEARRLDTSAVIDTSTTACSQINIGNLLADYRNSTATAISLFSAPACAGSNNQMFIGIAPSILAAGGQTFTNHSGAGAKVFFPTPSEQN